MAPTLAASGSPIRANGATNFRPLNAFMAFRSFFNKMLPHMQQKDRSGILTALWNEDPYKNKWTMVAKVFSYLRAELGKDAVSLPSFLEHACYVLGIPPLDVYLQQRGFALLENQTGHLTLIRSPYNFVRTVFSAPIADRDTVYDGKHFHIQDPDSSLQSPSPSVLKENISEDMPMATFASSIEKEPRRSQPGKTIGEDEGTVGLYAEHQLLQAVFDRGLHADLSHMKKGDDTEEKKQLLVQKLYSMAYEMLIGGESPVILSTNGFSRTIKHCPAPATTQLFSKCKSFDFDILVINKNDRVQNHVHCQHKSGCGQNPVETQKVAGHLSSIAPTTPVIKLASPPANATPTYTQNMAYQSPSHTGKFHVFSSQPSQLGNSIISNQSLTDNNLPNKSDVDAMKRSVSPPSDVTQQFDRSTYDFECLDNNIQINLMEYGTEQIVDDHPASSTNEGINNGGSTSNNSHSQVPTAAAIEDGRDWLNRELERIYNIKPNHEAKESVGSSSGGSDSRSSGSGGISGDLLTGGGHILTVSSDGRRDTVTVHSTDSPGPGSLAIANAQASARAEAQANARRTSMQRQQVAMLDGVLSSHLDTMGSDNEAADYMDRMSRMVSSAASTSVAAKTTNTANTSEPRRSSRVQRASTSSQSSATSSASAASSSLGKRSRGDSETLPGNGSSALPVLAPAPEEMSDKKKGKQPATDNQSPSCTKKVCHGRKESDVHLIHGYRKVMGTPEPIEIERPVISLSDDYRVNVATCIQGPENKGKKEDKGKEPERGNGKEAEKERPKPTPQSAALPGKAAAPAAPAAPAVQKKQPLPPPTAPPTRPLPSVPTTATASPVATAPASQPAIASSAPAAPAPPPAPVVHPTQTMQPIQPMSLDQPPRPTQYRPPQPAHARRASRPSPPDMDMEIEVDPVDMGIRSYQESMHQLTALNAMNSISSMQGLPEYIPEDLHPLAGMDPRHAMQGLPGMPGIVDDDIPLMSELDMEDAFMGATLPTIPPVQQMHPLHSLQNIQPIQIPVTHTLPTPAYDNTPRTSSANTTAYMGYNFAPQPTTMSSTMPTLSSSMTTMSSMPSVQNTSVSGPRTARLHSPNDDYVNIDQCFNDVANVDFTNSDEIRRIMSFCEDLGSDHAILDSMDDFQWI